MSLFNDENLKIQASTWVREHAVKKGEANMTARSFCFWVNDELLPSSNLPPHLPRCICLCTATMWLHRLGFRPTSHKKGAYIDGHERDDAVAHRKVYLTMLKGLHETHLPTPPASDKMAVTPPADAESRKKLVFIFHDKGQTWAWTTEAYSAKQEVLALWYLIISRNMEGFCDLPVVKQH